MTSAADPRPDAGSDTDGAGARPRVTWFGDAALLVEYDAGIDAGVNARVLALASALEERSFSGVRDVVPAFSSLAIHFDPLRTAVERLHDAVLSMSGHLREPERRGSTLDIPVCYGGDCGPDLPAVASWAGLPEREVAVLHAAPIYRVYMLGFLPGFPYLAPLDARIAIPRLDVPRPRVARGSVGIAGQQTGVYPVESPGGWRIIGRTPLNLFDPARSPATLLAPGDHVRFVAIDRQQLQHLEAQGGVP